MTATFLFYDLETSGLSAPFDQILTFAAIRTDLHLNELERYSLTVRLRPDIVPSPGAFIIHRLTPDELEKGLCEYEAACWIHEIFNTPGTISLGYNTLGFDDEFLRFTFYRNLLEPYTHQYANGCCRMDLLPIVTLYRIFKPEVIQWPEVDGKPSLKLELISELNNLVSSGRAHDAMTDVEATLALARHLKSQQKMWDYCLGFFDKKEDRTRLNKIPAAFHAAGQDYRAGLMVSLKFGKDLMYMAPVLGIGDSIPYANQSLWLRLDQNILPESGHLNMDEQFVIRKKYGEPGIVLPPFERFWNRIPNAQKNRVAENKARLNGNKESCGSTGNKKGYGNQTANKEAYRNQTANKEAYRSREMFKKIIRHHREFKYPFVPEVDMDAALYQSPFFTIPEKKESSRFHAASLPEKMRLFESSQMTTRLKSLACRILFRNYSEADLPPSILIQRDAYMERVGNRCPEKKSPIMGYKNDYRLTADRALEEISRLSAESPDDEMKNKWEQPLQRDREDTEQIDQPIKMGSGDQNEVKTKKEEPIQLLDEEQKDILLWLKKYINTI